jgi:DeoR/GlpR family transcriptional regulator of sugar metabolism
MTRLIGPQRQAAILEALRRRGAISIQELVQQLGVSPMTIRRDLDELEAQGQLERTYGGATLAPNGANDPSFARRTQVQVSAKHAIAQRAAQLLNPGDKIILDSGTTVAATAGYLADIPDLTVITYSLPVIHALATQSDVAVVSTGGSIDPTINATVGPLAERVLADVRVDKALIGATSVSLEDGFSNSNLHNVALQQIVLRVAREVYLLVDAAKFSRPPFWLVAQLSALSGIVTDSAPSEAWREKLAQAGVALYVAGEADPNEQVTMGVVN